MGAFRRACAPVEASFGGQRGAAGWLAVGEQRGKLLGTPLDIPWKHHMALAPYVTKNHAAAAAAAAVDDGAVVVDDGAVVVVVGVDGVVACQPPFALATPQQRQHSLQQQTAQGSGMVVVGRGHLEEQGKGRHPRCRQQLVAPTLANFEESPRPCQEQEKLCLQLRVGSALGGHWEAPLPRRCLPRGQGKRRAGVEFDEQSLQMSGHGCFGTAAVRYRACVRLMGAGASFRWRAVPGRIDCSLRLSGCRLTLLLLLNRRLGRRRDSVREMGKGGLRIAVCRDAKENDV